MCIKPATEGGGVGAARLATPADLAVYAHCIQNREAVLPALSLSWDNPSIAMPQQRPPYFLVEPYIPADR